MADGFGISINGDERVVRDLRRLTLFLKDLRPFWPLVVPLWISWMRRQFESEGAFAGETWAPLSEDYANAKAIQFPGKGLLVAEGDLRQAVSKPNRTMTPHTLVLSVDWASEKGKPVDLAWHQHGTTRMPARPLMFGEPLPIEARAELEAVADRYVVELVHRLGLRR